MKAKVTAIVNDKGGVGKTLCTVNLAYLISQKAKTLLIDFDVQANSSVFYREDFASLEGSEFIFTADPTVKYSQAIVADEPVPNLYICTANKRLGENAAQASVTSPMRDYLLRNALRACDDDFEHIIIDCPPSPINLQKDNAIACANEIIIPVTPDIASFQGVVSVVHRISAMNTTEPTIRIIVNGFQLTTKSINRRMEGWISELKDGLNDMLANNKHGNPVNIIFDDEQIKIKRAISATEAHSLYYPLEIADKNSETNQTLHLLARRIAV